MLNNNVRIITIIIIIVMKERLAFSYNLQGLVNKVHILCVTLP